jgi:acyl-CoA synthetase (AMP-forming)/AMP-acid ligase II
MALSGDSGIQQPDDTLWAALETQVRLFPNKIAYRLLDNALREREAITFGDLRVRAQNKSAQLARRGLVGRPVALFQPTGLDFIVNFFAVLRGGGTVVPLNPRLLLNGGEELKPILADAAPVALLCDQPTADRFQRTAAGAETIRLEVIPEEDRSMGSWDDVEASAAHPSSIAVIQYTSGSTSAPKGVCVTHANFLSNARILTKIFEAGPDDVAISWLPFFHDMGLMTGLIWPVTEGASATLLRASTFAARPQSWLRALSEYKGTISAGPNFAYQLCVDRVAREEVANLDLSSWRVAICGAEPINPDTVEQFLERYMAAGFDPCCLFPSYGLAEATLFVSGGRRGAPPRVLGVDAQILERQGIAEPSISSADARRLVACGAPASNLDVAVVDPQMLSTVPERTVGEIWIRGPSVAVGYLGQDDLNREVFGGVVANDQTASRFLRTGDLGFLDQGDLFVVGRLKDLIIVRGTKYAPQDLELTCARAHPSLEGCRSVVFALEGKPDGGIVVLHEARHLDGGAEAVIEALRGAIAQSHGVGLHAVALLPSNALPLTSSGKVRRAPTRSAWLAGSLPVVAAWRADEPLKTAAVSIVP